MFLVNICKQFSRCHPLLRFHRLHLSLACVFAFKTPAKMHSIFWIQIHNFLLDPVLPQIHLLWRHRKSQNKLSFYFAYKTQQTRIQISERQLMLFRLAQQLLFCVSVKLKIANTWFVWRRWQPQNNISKTKCLKPQQNGNILLIATFCVASWARCFPNTIGMMTLTNITRADTWFSL